MGGKYVTPFRPGTDSGEWKTETGSSKDGFGGVERVLRVQGSESGSESCGYDRLTVIHSPGVLGGAKIGSTLFDSM